MAIVDLDSRRRTSADLREEAHTPAPLYASDPAALARAGQRVVDYRMSHPTVRNKKRQPMTQVELAAKASVSPGCLQAFEVGSRITRIDNVRRIAKAIDLTVEELFAPDPTEVGKKSPVLDNDWPEEVRAIADAINHAPAELRVVIKHMLVEWLSLRPDPRLTELRTRILHVSYKVPSKGVQPGGDLPPAAGVPFRNGSER